MSSIIYGSKTLYITLVDSLSNKVYFSKRCGYIQKEILFKSINKLNSFTGIILNICIKSTCYKLYLMYFVLVFLILIRTVRQSLKYVSIVYLHVNSKFVSISLFNLFILQVCILRLSNDILFPPSSIYF